MERSPQAGTFDNYGAQAPLAEQGVINTVRNAASSVAEKGHDALVSAKDKAGEIPSMLADRLDAGADSIRPDHQIGVAGATGALVDNTKMAKASDSLANGMQAGADWLRNADLNKMRDGIEQQVKDKPAQSLLIALGVGYMLGKAVRR